MKVYGIAHRYCMGHQFPSIDWEDIDWDTNRDAVIAEYNARDDKCWDAALVEAEVSGFKVIHDSGGSDTAPWERNYDGHYYEDN